MRDGVAEAPSPGIPPGHLAELAHALPAGVPFVHRRRVVWSDTDPAGIAYTGRFADFALEAIEAWSAERLGVSWFAAQQVGTIVPFVRMEMTFRAPLRPDDDLLTTVVLLDAGHTSITTHVVGRLASGATSFEGRFVQVFATAALGKLPIPADYRDAIERELAVAHTEDF